MSTKEQGSSRRQWERVLWRGLGILVLAVTIGWMLSRIAASLERSARPAGFGRGVLQGALMPLAMPNLMVGKDVTIYAQNNTGLSYKLGYTVGVNSCGALFFGLFFWRLTQWRRAARAKGQGNDDRGAGTL